MPLSLCDRSNRGLLILRLVGLASGARRREDGSPQGRDSATARLGSRQPSSQRPARHWLSRAPSGGAQACRGIGLGRCGLSRPDRFPLLGGLGKRSICRCSSRTAPFQQAKVLEFSGSAGVRRFVEVWKTAHCNTEHFQLCGRQSRCAFHGLGPL